MAAKFGVVLVTHGDLGQALMETCSLITGRLKNIAYVSVEASNDVDKIRDEIEKAINEVNGENGCLLLVDMFGGTPSNISLSFLREGRTEVVTGVNLPMLTKLYNLDSSLNIRQAAAVLRDYGRDHIKVAAEYLSGD
ncbi:MAG: PTS sugar transporter subunit IIA [bacterium]